MNLTYIYDKIILKKCIFVEVHLYLKRIILSLFAIIIVITVIFSSSLSILGAADDESYDYSNPSAVNNRQISSDMLLEAYLGDEISDEERAYLAEYGSVTVRYDDSISTGNVVCIFEDGRLTVNAAPYVYTTQSGQDAVWTPVSVRVGDREEALLANDAYYTAELDGISEDDSLYAEVRYVLRITVKREDISLILNQAYNDAPEWESRLAAYREEYGRLLGEYNSGLIDYNLYLEALARYDSDVAAYNDYLVRKKLYDDAKREYDAYLAEYAAYTLALDGYNEYLENLEKYNTAYSEYMAYKSALGKYESDILTYNENLEALERVRLRIAILDAAKLPMTDGRDVYSAIWSGLVDEVLANKSLITSQNVGVSEEVVYAAGDSTENLRNLLKSYYSLTEEEDKYTFYMLNYGPLKENFKKLTQALDDLYRARAVRNYLRNEGKDFKYMILVAQLALISSALEGEPIKSYYGTETLDGSYVMKRETMSFSEILENKAYIDTSVDPKPDSLGYPTLGDEPTPPSVVEEPTAPIPVNKPTPPELLENPGDAPTPVDEPTVPERVEEPTPPTEYTPPECIPPLISAYNRGEISLRPMADDDFIYEAVRTVKKKLFNVDEVSVFFLSEGGEELYGTVVDKGTCAVYVGELPEKPEDDGYTYTFVGWGGEDGVLTDISEVESDLILYPIFDKHTKSYDITYVFPDGTVTVSHPYGSVPAFDNIPNKPDEGNVMYVFSGWDTPIAPVSGNATYTALYTPEYIVKLGTSGADIDFSSGVYTVDCTKSAFSEIDLGNIVDRAVSKQASLYIRTIFCEIDIPYSTLVSMQESSSTVLVPDIVSVGSIGYSYRLGLMSEDSSRAEKLKMTVSVGVGIDDLSRHVLCLLENGNVGSRVRYSVNNGKLLFTINTNCTYTLMPEFGINVITSPAGTLEVSSLSAFPGDKIYVSSSMTPGHRFVGVRVFGADGSEIPFEDGEFVMPAYDVSLVLLSEEMIYTVRFMDGNQVLAEVKCRYGDIPKPPKSVNKMNDDQYSYTFIGWSDEIAPADSDKVYYAVYDVSVLPPKVRPEGLVLSPTVLKLLIALLVAVFMIIAVVIPSLITLTVLFIKDKKRRLRRREK